MANKKRRGQRGAISPDGSPVEVYRRIPYFGEVERLRKALPPGSSILEVGCGTGRMTRELLRAGYSVTAVDIEPAMLSLVPARARKVCGDIRKMDLRQRFDVVILASNLINKSDAERRALVRACRRHLADDGHFVFERLPLRLMRRMRVGYISMWPTGLEHFVDDIHCEGDQYRICIRYQYGDQWWKQRLRGRLLTHAFLAREFREFGLRPPRKIDESWSYTRPY